MWKVECEEGQWFISWGGHWMPNAYQSKEEAMAALLDHLSKWFGE